MRARNSGIILVTILMLMCVGSVQAAGDTVDFLGEYSNVKSDTSGHCDGYSVALWKHKEALIGLLYHQHGLCEDAPMGVIRDITYAASAGSISFRVKLSDGVTFHAGKWGPTRDIIKFNGEMHGPSIKGLAAWYRDGEKQRQLAENITLTVEHKNDASYKSFASYDEWVKYWEPILKKRGPQWQ